MKYLVIAFLTLFSLPAASQQVNWDSTFRPGNFAQKTAQFESYADSRKDIIFLGNSITAGVDWHELLNNAHARNRGISGDITFGVLERLNEVTTGKPAKVFILIGINDIQRNIPDSVIVNNYRRMISYIRQQSPKTKIYFQTLMPVNNEFTQFKNHYNKDEHIQWVNSQIRMFASTENVTVVDLHPHFLNSEGKLDKRYTMDGLHLNAEGYKVWASVLKNGNYIR